MTGEARDHADQGFERVAAGASSTAGNRFYAVKAINGTATWDTGCTVSSGSPPSVDDTLLQNAELEAPFTLVKVKAGSAGVLYCFHDAPQ